MDPEYSSDPAQDRPTLPDSGELFEASLPPQSVKPPEAQLPRAPLAIPEKDIAHVARVLLRVVDNIRTHSGDAERNAAMLIDACTGLEYQVNVLCEISNISATARALSEREFRALTALGPALHELLRPGHATASELSEEIDPSKFKNSHQVAKLTQQLREFIAALVVDSHLNI